MSVIRVALPVPLRYHFDYQLDNPENICIGARVRVPFGKRELIGIVWQLEPKDQYSAELKSVIEVIDREPIFSEELRDLLSFAADYYHHPLGDVLVSALPTLLREGRRLSDEKQRRAELTMQGLAVTASDFKRSAKQLALWQLLAQSSQTQAQIS